MWHIFHNKFPGLDNVQSSTAAFLPTFPMISSQPTYSLLHDPLLWHHIPKLLLLTIGAAIQVVTLSLQLHVFLLSGGNISSYLLESLAARFCSFTLTSPPKLLVQIVRVKRKNKRRPLCTKMKDKLRKMPLENLKSI